MSASTIVQTFSKEVGLNEEMQYELLRALESDSALFLMTAT
jgi:hypothetical protein